MSWYIKYYHRENRQGTDVVFEKYFKAIDGKILDVGCSVGNFISNDPKRIVGVDIDEDAIKICKKRGFKAYLVDMEKNAFFKPKTFSAIHCNHVIEHIGNPEIFLKNLKSLLKPGGFVYIRTVDIRYEKWKFWNDYTHKIPYTLNSLRMLFENVRFKKIEVKRDFAPIRGAGFLLRKGKLKPITVLKIQDLLYKMRVASKVSIVGIGYV